MSENPLRALEACGTAVWSDFIRRSFVENGDLQRLVEQDGISGVTSNPTIFEKAIGGSDDYDQQLEKLARQGLSPEDIFKEIAATDITMAADVLRPVYDRTKSYDGYVSVEVTPSAAHDTQRTLDDAHWFWKRIGRPNVMIKVPATPEGMPAIEQLISEGINVNITLIFAVEVYVQVIEAYLRGLERRLDAGQPLDHVASVASFFVSRVDTLVDKLLSAREKDGQQIKDLEGKAAVANARIAYQKFQEIFGSDRFERLKQHGAQVQRPLWASTSTKNPNYPDTMYVDELAGKHCVNTMPPQTIVAVRDHGRITCDTVEQDIEGAHDLMKRLAAAGIDMDAVTDQLTVEGVQSFVDSIIQLYGTIREKARAVLAQGPGSDRASLNGQQSAVDESLNNMAETHMIQRIWEKDPSVWKPKTADQSEITDRLGWLHVSDCMLENKDRFAEIAQAVRDLGMTHAVVLGMGGSSLAPYVLSQTFGRQPGFPELLVLDSTDPEAVRAIEDQIEPDRTLFIVSSKSGTTTEPTVFMETFWAKVEATQGQNAGGQFVAITDPGTPLEKVARERRFREVYVNPADIGGRYSALSYFGLIPAAVMGLDVPRLLDSALRMEHACGASVAPNKNPGAWLGAIMADLAQSGRDKVTFLLSESIATFGLWLEQLLAESTGKEGKGLVPVPGNPPGSPEDYADDRLFVYIQLTGDNSGDLDSKVQSLEKAGRPVVRLRLENRYDIGSEFFRWEFATAVAGALIGINAFDQPNVQESKDNTKRLLQEFESRGALPEPQPVAESDGFALFVNEPARSLIGRSSRDLEADLSELLSTVHAPQYLAIQAYVAPNAQHDQVLEPLRASVRDARKVAVTLGYGPRFLHSTGQLHKGGPPEGVFLQITARPTQDVPIPGESYTYGTLIDAQALGDFQALEKHGRPAISIRMPDESERSIQRLARMITNAVQRKVAARA
ncbi:MAG TPA: bifunctional transaldolase/phosoglucose isomerase [Chloroflexota bacterium]|nr:bifunctional transaldolase/phosoglucose isomerase [Chloroflexota bacterium]